MSHWRNDSGSPGAGGTTLGGRARLVARGGLIVLATALAAPTASMPAVARSVAAKEALVERASTTPTAL